MHVGDASGRGRVSAPSPNGTPVPHHSFPGAGGGPCRPYSSALFIDRTDAPPQVVDERAAEHGNLFFTVVQRSLSVVPVTVLGLSWTHACITAAARSLRESGYIALLRSAALLLKETVLLLYVSTISCRE